MPCYLIIVARVVETYARKASENFQWILYTPTCKIPLKGPFSDYVMVNVTILTDLNHL